MVLRGRIQEYGTHCAEVEMSLNEVQYIANETAQNSAVFRVAGEEFQNSADLARRLSRAQIDAVSRGPTFSPTDSETIGKWYGPRAM